MTTRTAQPTQPTRPARAARLLLRGATAFVLSSLVLVVGSSQLAPGWRPGEVLPPLDPAPLSLPQDAVLSATERRERAITHDDGTTARAWLVLPRAAADAASPASPTSPAVVLVHGGGPAGRDRMLPLAEAFAAAGVAAITYDKRTEGYSTALHRDFGQLAQDAIDVGEALRTQPGIDPERIGVLGYSEGGWVVPTAAAQRPDLFSFLMLGSVSLPTPLQEVLWIADSRLAGAPGWVRRAPSGVLSGGRGLLDYLDDDELEALAHVKVPIYAVWGAEDTTTPVAASAVDLDRVATAPVTGVLLPGTGHQLGQGPWVDHAAQWVRAPQLRSSLSGVEPVSRHGAATPHEPSWLLNPIVHLGLSLGVAALVVRFSDRRSTRRSPIQPSHASSAGPQRGGTRRPRKGASR